MDTLLPPLAKNGTPRLVSSLSFSIRSRASLHHRVKQVRRIAVTGSKDKDK